MGAWGTGSFENDDAMDWLAEVEDAEDTDLVLDTLQAVLDSDYVEADDASRAVAAAEVVAAMLGKGAPRLPKEVAAWAKGQGAPDAELVTAAKAALKVVLEGSELRSLWDDSDEADRWEAGIKALIARLG